MEIIKIGNDAMKISLCTDEAREMGLGNDQSADVLKARFTELLLKVKNGFNYRVLGGKLVGDIFSGLDGGCEIFVSRVEAQEEMYRDRQQEECVKKQKPTIWVYSFDTLERLLAVTRRLQEIGYDGASAVYYDDSKKKYYIFLDNVSIKDIKYAFVSEYARAVKPNLILHIKEHCKCLCKKNGVKTLCQC